MAKTYTASVPRRIVNWFAKGAIRLGAAPRGWYILTTVGRRTGATRHVPVQLVEVDGRRWLVGPYGSVGWVHNARASGRVTITRGRRTTEAGVEEVGPQRAAPILRHYLEQVPIVRPYFDVTTESPLDDFERDAARHPVFLIEDS